MRILQLSDIHLRGDGRLSFHKMNTMEAFRKTIDYLEAMVQQPDLYVITGDLADNGNAAAYGVLKAMLARLEKPVYIVPGNHDKRELLSEYFPECCPVEEDIKPYICYTLDQYPVRIIAAETINQGKHWGCLTDPVADWLEAKLREEPLKPTILFTHHPPFQTGLNKMDEPFGNVDRFREILKTNKNLRVCCGHIHRAITTVWDGIPVCTCPPVSMLMELDFSADGGDAFFLSDPGYLIHDDCGGLINTHVGTVPTQADYAGPFPFAYLESDKK